jgi:anti-anti-sigma factor
MATLNIDVAEVGQAQVVTLTGEGSAANAMSLEMAVTRLCAVRPRAVVLDLSRLAYIASLCMGCLVALRRSITSHGGTVRIAGASDEVATAMRRAKLDLILPMDQTIAESLAAAGTSQGAAGGMYS